MAISELKAIRDGLKEKERENKLKITDRNKYGNKDLTPFNALVRLVKGEQNIIY